MVFVSHDIKSILLLCKKAILLKQGQLLKQGPAQLIVNEYLALGHHKEAERTWSFDDAPASKQVKLHSVQVRNTEGHVSFNHYYSQAIEIYMDFWCLTQVQITPNFHIYNQNGLFLFPTANLHIEGWGNKIYDSGFYSCTCIIPGSLLNSGTYFIHVYLSTLSGTPYVHVPNVVSFQVIDDGTGRGAYRGASTGIIRPLLEWRGEVISTI